jgi:squalene-hopene/tetraprenyl-beta-curcumene cyclase
MGLLAAGEPAASAPIRRGVDYLLRSQCADGSWEDEHWTGTGFPNVFYLRYHLYATYFPLLALSTFVRAAAETDSDLRMSA